MAASRDEIVAALIKSYNMELETVINYLANSIALDGVRAEQIKSSLGTDITEELTHAQRVGNRIKELEGRIPGSQQLIFEQAMLQPPSSSTDVVTVIKGVIDAENGAIEQYRKIAKMCDGEDFVTQDLVIELMADEESHRREFIGFLKEYESGA